MYLFDWVAPVIIAIVVVPAGIVAMVNLVGAVALTGAVIRKKKKCNKIKELE